MCFIAVLLLKRAIDEALFSKMLRDMGFEVSVREYGGRRVIEAHREKSRLKAVVEGNKVSIETNDYGPDCVKDYRDIFFGLEELDLDPKAVYVSSPYIYAYEKRRGRTKKLLEELGVEAEEVYSGYCG